MNVRGYANIKEDRNDQTSRDSETLSDVKDNVAMRVCWHLYVLL